MLYYKIYHYSREKELSCIDPNYYGTGLTRGAECKRAKTGLNKSYFYVEDKPEVCVRSGAHRYEIYLPQEWKSRIYDLGIDENNFCALAKENILSRNGNRIEYVYDYLLRDEIELLIYKNGYKGFCNTQSTLPHAITLFQKISTQLPKQYKAILDWQEKIIETSSWKAFDIGFFKENINTSSDFPESMLNTGFYSNL